MPLKYDLQFPEFYRQERENGTGTDLKEGLFAF